MTYFTFKTFYWWSIQFVSSYQNYQYGLISATAKYSYYRSRCLNWARNVTIFHHDMCQQPYCTMHCDLLVKLTNLLITLDLPYIQCYCLAKTKEINRKLTSLIALEVN